MKRIVTAAVVLGVIAIFTAAVSRAVFAAETAAKKDASAAKADASAKTKAKTVVPPDRVVVMYFHRTQRCPTCRKMGSYSEEAVKGGFAKLVKRGKVEFHFIDFQDKKNARIAAGYQVQGPTLIVAKVAKNKVVKYLSLEEMWSKVGEKDEFIAYVQSNVKNALK
jgi:hypothetical protein